MDCLHDEREVDTFIAMNTGSETHLERLASLATSAKLDELDFVWKEADSAVCAVARFKRLEDRPPRIVGLLGGASSGKSTLFNSLLEKEISCISAHAHETLGPIVTVHDDCVERLKQWITQGLIFSEFDSVEWSKEGPLAGQIGAVHLYQHNRDKLKQLLLVDTPDVTSKSSADEGSITRNFLPWFDDLIVVVDEERWYDASVFQEIIEHCRDYAPRLWVVFNRTERMEPLDSSDTKRLEEHAGSFRVSGSCVSPFCPGCGYRPVSAETKNRLYKWFESESPDNRLPALDDHLRRRCVELAGQNVSRKESYDRLCHAVDGLLGKMVDDTSLSYDLLTEDERGLLGIGHRFLPFHDLVKGLRKKLGAWGLITSAGKEIDFEKRADALVDVLQKNLEIRFRYATDHIDEIVADNSYVPEEYKTTRDSWNIPEFDAREWAVRIRGHIDEWKKESARKSRSGDVAAFSVGVPLLLADLFFLGGAGTTLTWAAVWVTGFFGGKGIMQLLQRSPAFNAYQTTVRSYQALIREALSDQWEKNLNGLPRRHMKMTDPVLQSIMYWATPGRR